MKFNIYIAITIITLLICLPVWADNKKDNKVNTVFGIPLKAELSIAFSRDKGNVDEETFKYGFHLKSKTRKNTSHLKFKGKWTEKRNKRSKEKYKEKYEVRFSEFYHFNETSALYGDIFSYI